MINLGPQLLQASMLGERHDIVVPKSGYHANARVHDFLETTYTALIEDIELYHIALVSLFVLAL